MDDLAAFLRDLGRGHRKFGTLAEHYDAVGASLLATFAHFCGDAWDAELEADWRGAYELIAGVMTAAAQEDEQQHPAYWTGTVVGHERRAFDVAVLTVAHRAEPRLRARTVRGHRVASAAATVALLLDGQRAAR